MIGIGTDIVQIDRIKESFDKLSDRFVQRILTAQEISIFVKRNHSMVFLANRFAAKEAVSKALGTGIAQGIRFTDIEILPDDLGAPTVQLHGKALERLNALQGQQVKISLSDERDFAVAFAVVV
jgi:holo-[acyl-carrier protein] synthase